MCRVPIMQIANKMTYHLSLVPDIPIVFSAAQNANLQSAIKDYNLEPMTIGGLRNDHAELGIRPSNAANQFASDRVTAVINCKAHKFK